MVGGITCLPTAEGWLHLACWPDLVTREIVGYAMADHHCAFLVTDALKMARGRARLRPGRVMYGDFGSEYTSAAFRHKALLKEEIGTRLWPAGPPPAPRSSTSSRPFTTAAACASTGPSARARFFRIMKVGCWSIRSMIRGVNEGV
ncbi:DDE-type integrase/transposase/recombinase [Streptomyces sp. JL4002]|uniref:DDE-type integrase/transposase/recombinase n=1 Tax=Streptomyces sp. JL4002 TaxID=3404781 RepID=UPI003B28B21E